MKKKPVKVLLLGLLMMTASGLLAQDKAKKKKGHGNDDGIPPDDQLRVKVGIIGATTHIKDTKTMLGRQHGDDEGIPPDDLGRNAKPLNTATIFPNPVQRLTHLQVPSLGTYKVVVYTLGGQEVFNAAFVGNECTLDLAALPNGIYWVNIYDNHQYSVIQKVIKQ